MKVYETHYPNHLSYAFPKQSKYFEFLNYKLLKIMETGIFHLLHNKFVSSPMECNVEGDVSMSFVKLVSVFAVLGTGCALSIILLSAEGINHKKSMHKKNDKDIDEIAMDVLNGSSAIYETKLRKFMFKWGVSNRSMFMEELDELMSLSQSQNTADKQILFVKSARNKIAPATYSTSTASNHNIRQFTYPDIFTTQKDIISDR